MKIKPWFIMAVFTAMSLVFVSCQNSSDVEDEDFVKEESFVREAIPLNGATRSVANGLSDFYLNFTKDVCSYADGMKDESKNVVVSPLSVSFMLGMLSNGLSGEEAKLIYDYIGTNDIQSLNELCNILLEKLPKADNLVDLKLVNSIWIDKSLSLSNSFKSLMEGYYAPQINNVDFSGRTNEVKNRINSWAEENTGGKIKNYIENLNPGIFAMLMNAMYFKGYWASEYFDTARVTKDNFYGVAGAKKVDMMESSVMSVKFLSSQKYTYVSVPYGNSAYSLEIFIPRGATDPKEGFESLTPEIMKTMLERVTTTDIILTLPKFKAESKYDISEVMRYCSNRLGSLNLTKDCKMFTTSPEGEITLRQGAGIVVNEKGSEGAAVSSAEIGYTSSGMEMDPIEVKVDRPFMFFIREYSTGACVLSGRIAEL